MAEAARPKIKHLWAASACGIKSPGLLLPAAWLGAGKDPASSLPLPLPPAAARGMWNMLGARFLAKAPAGCTAPFPTLLPSPFGLP